MQIHESYDSSADESSFRLLFIKRTDESMINK